MEAKSVLLVGGDVRGAAAVAGGGLRPLDVQVEQLHLQEGNSTVLTGLVKPIHCAGGLLE